MSAQVANNVCLGSLEDMHSKKCVYNSYLMHLVRCTDSSPLESPFDDWLREASSNLQSWVRFLTPPHVTGE